MAPVAPGSRGTAALVPGPLVPPRVRRALPVYAGIAIATIAGVGVRVHGHRRASRFDRWIDTRARVTGHPWHGLVYLLAQGGSPALAILAALVLAALCWWWRDRLAALLCLLAPGINDVLTEVVLKPWVARTKAASLAFPSGHTGRAVALATVVVLLAGKDGPVGRRLPAVARRVVQALAILTAAGVGFAVVSLTWHYATDAAGAVLLATSVTLTLAAVLDRWRAPEPAGDRPISLSARSRGTGS